MGCWCNRQHWPTDCVCVETKDVLDVLNWQETSWPCQLSTSISSAFYKTMNTIGANWCVGFERDSTNRRHRMAEQPKIYRRQSNSNGSSDQINTRPPTRLIRLNAISNAQNDFSFIDGTCYSTKLLFVITNVYTESQNGRARQTEWSNDWMSEWPNK